MANRLMRLQRSATGFSKVFAMLMLGSAACLVTLRDREGSGKSRNRREERR